MQQALERVKDLYQSRGIRARELRDVGKKVIGYFCCTTPVEFITALDLVPYRIMGSMREPVTEADAHLETIMCSYVRSCFDLALKGSYNFLDGFVVPHSCDVIHRVYDIWKHCHRPVYSHFINIPHMIDLSSHQFFKDELATFQKSLEEFAGKRISIEALREAIRLHNENRGLLRQLYNLMKLRPPLLSGSEALEIVITIMTIPVQESNELLRDVIREIISRKEHLANNDTRVLVYGSEIDDITLIELIEGCGVNVVTDDLCTGTRYFWSNVDVTDDVLDGIANRYLVRIPCPRTYRPSCGSTKADLESRFGYLKNYAQEFGVNAVIMYITRFCDTYEFDAPPLRNYLSSIRLPVLYLEEDYCITGVGQLKTRVQAFVEMVASIA